MVSINYFLACTLACLPHRQGFHKNGGWRNAPLPGNSNFTYYLNQHFTQIEIQAAEKQAGYISKANLPLQSLHSHIKSGFISIWDPQYPLLLRNIFDPPPILFYALYGNKFPDSTSNFQAIVGTRRPHKICKAATNSWVKELASKFENLWIVSGLARGVDRLAHLQAIENGIGTVAVLGSGLFHAGPQANLDLLQKTIQHNGSLLLLSEFHNDLQASRWTFPRRNRIIAGMADCTAVIQAPKRSGSMITARFALEEGREVVAFDHPIFKESLANNGAQSLLNDGANPIVLNEEPGQSIARESWGVSRQQEFQWHKEFTA